MKRIFTVIVMAMLVFAGCSNEELVNENTANKYATLTASIEQGPADSRIAISNENSIAWSDGDVIRVFMKNSQPEYYDYKYSNGVFTPQNPQSIIPNNTTNDDVIGVATLKADDDGEYTGCMEGNKFSSGFAQNTVVVDGSESRAIITMWGTWNNGNINFKHLGGVLRINLTGLPAGYDFLAIIADKPISGNAYVEDVTDTSSDLVLEMDDSYTADGDHNLITVRFENAATRTMHVALPVDTYNSIQVIVSKYDENNEEGVFTDPIVLANFTNKQVQRAHIYTASFAVPTVAASTPAAVSTELSNNSNQGTYILTQQIDATITGAGEINIPDASSNTILDFQVAPKTSSTSPLVFNKNATQNNPGTATGYLNINMPAGAQELYATINAPTTTVTLNGGKYKAITAKTATNTLIIKNGVEIETLTVEGGNVIIEDGADVTNITNTGSGTIQKNVDTAEKLETAIADEKYASVALSKDIELSSLITINRNITLDLNGKNISTTSSKHLIKIAENTNVTIKNGGMENQYANGRCIFTTGGNINLTLERLNLITSGGSKDQSFTIGGNAGTNLTEPNITVTMDECMITSSHDGYAIVTYNPVNMTIKNGSTINGFGALYIKDADDSFGSMYSTFTIQNSVLISSNSTNSDPTNDFATIQIDDSNITIDISSNSIIQAETINNTQYLFRLGNSLKGNVADSKVTIHSGNGLSLGEKCNILGFGSAQTTGLDNNIVIIPNDFKDKIAQEGFGCTDNDDETITITESN